MQTDEVYLPLNCFIYNFFRGIYTSSSTKKPKHLMIMHVVYYLTPICNPLQIWPS